MSWTDDVDDLVKSNLTGRNMNEVDAERSWEEITRRLDDEITPSPVRSIDEFEEGFQAPRPRRRPWLVGAFAGVAMAATLALAILPGSRDDSDAPLDIPHLESASAATVLGEAADAARSRKSLVPGPDELLYSSSETIAPFQSRKAEVIQEWIGAKGDGRTQSKTVFIDPKTGKVVGDPTRKPEVTQFSATNEPATDVNIGESWRATLTFREVRALPTEPLSLLEKLRATADRAAGRTGDYDAESHRIFGRDLFVLVIAARLLANAPLDGDQRAALFEVLTTAPDWSRSDGKARLEIDNLGRTETRDKTDGISLRTTLDLSAADASATNGTPGRWSLDTVLDPTTGDVLEFREREAGEPEPSVITFQKPSLTQK